MSDYSPKEVYNNLEWYQPKKDRTYKPNIEYRVWECGDRVIPMKEGTIYKSDKGDIYELKNRNWIVTRFGVDLHKNINR